MSSVHRVIPHIKSITNRDSIGLFKSPILYISTPLQSQILAARHTRRYASSSSSGKSTTSAPAVPPPVITNKHNLPTLSCFSLQGKTVIITGGARGLGLVMAKGLISSGAGIALVDLDYDEAKRAASSLKEWHGSTNSTPTPIISAHLCNVTSPESISNCFSNVLAAHPSGPTTLITSAGFTRTIPALEYPPKMLSDLLETNISGTFNWAVEFAKWFSANKDHKETKGASVILIGSMSASIVNTPQKQTPYNLSKAAVRHMAASLAVEWAELGIRVNCLSPGYMATKLYVACHILAGNNITRTDEILTRDPLLKKHWVERIPLGHMGDPADLVGVVVWLSSEASRYVTGAEIRVDGGYTVL